MGSKGRAFIAELFRFHLVGAGTLVVGTLVFLGLLAAGLGYMPALAGDYAAGILFSYYMNKHFTFRARLHSDVKPLSVTILTYLVTFLLNVVLLGMAVEMAELPVIPAQVVIMLALALLNYAAFRFVIFGVLARHQDVPRPAASGGDR